MDKKGQGISINTIIIAAIALAVLVVLFAIFTGRIGSFSRGVSETVTCKNACANLALEKASDTTNREACEGTAGSPTGNRYVPGTYSDVTAGRVCCCLRPPLVG